jgi:hypothetical protein
MSDADWVLIPMEVSALVVGTEAEKSAWSDLTPDFNQVYSNKILTGRDLIKRKVFQTAGASPPSGIHLHWFLPEAFGHGVEDEGGSLAFPLVPNRWLIRRARHAANAIDVTEVTDWLLESDYCWKTDPDEFKSAKDNTGVSQSAKDKTRILLDRDRLFANVGKLSLLGHGKRIDAPNGYGFKLTALGSVGPEFAASYPACKSVLGFCDPDPAGGGADTIRVSYLVVGWYSDPAKDLLSGSERESWDSRLTELGWTLSSCPWRREVRSMCHGAVAGITWNSRFLHKSGAPAPTSEAKVYIGATPAEALATLLAREMKPQSSDSVELLLAAFQYGMLAGAEHLGDVQADFHRRRFTASPGGERYGVNAKARPVQPNADPPARDLEPTSVSAILPPEIDGLLVNLNSKASALARVRRDLASLRQARFTAWASWAKDYLNARNSAKKQPVFPDMNPGLVAMAKGESAATVERDKARETLENALAARFPDLELSCSAELPFFRPAEPAILIEGAGLKASGIFDTRDSSEALPCRWVKEIVSGISATIVQETRTALARNLIPFPSPTWSLSSGPSPDLLDALLREFILVAPLEPAGPPVAPQDKPWNMRVRTSLTQGISLDGGEQASLANEIDGLVAARPPAGPFGLKFISDASDVDSRLPHPVAIARWTRNPWRPLFLAWEVKWLPDDQLKGAGDIPGKWSPWPLDETGNEFKTPDAIASAPDANKAGFQAYTLLGPRPELVLRRRLQQLGQRSRVGGEGDWTKVISKIDSLEILAQSLAGFHDSLRQLSLGLQLPLINPAYLWDKTQPVKDPAADPSQGFLMVDPQRMQAPDTSFEFQPIRAGRLEVARLWVVDSFGQTRKLIEPNADCPLFTSFGLPGLSTISKRRLVPLPPRYVQPARLDFRWVACPGDAAGGSPVRGWIFPNQMDKSIMICGAAGRLFGMLRRPIGASSEMSATFVWFPVPGTDVAVNDIPDDDLRAFVKYLVALNRDDAEAFGIVLRNAQNDGSGAVEHDPRLAILVGKPLALARASLQIQLDSISVSRAPEVGAGGAAPSNPTRQFEAVKFPVRLGGPDGRAGPEGRAGGLAGFFEGEPGKGEPGEGEPGKVFYPGYGLSGRTDLDQIKYLHELPLDAKTTEPLTLLLDPTAPVHIRSGLLPLHTFHLPEAAAAAVSSIRDVFFQAAPLLGSRESESPRMPRPSDDYGRWSWAVRPSVTMWKEYADIADPGDRAMFGQQALALREGWLKLVMNPVSVAGFWVKEGATKVEAGSRITLGWMVEGAESLTLTASVIVNGAATKQELAAWSKDEATALPNSCPIQIDKNWRGATAPPRSAEDTEAGSEIISLSLIASDRAGRRAMKSIQLTLTRS